MIEIIIMIALPFLAFVLFLTGGYLNWWDQPPAARAIVKNLTKIFSN